MDLPGAETVLVRYGEIGLKSTRVQERMETRLAENIRAQLGARGLDETVERGRTRLFVDSTPERIDPVTDAVTDTFGVVSASPAIRTDPTLPAIRETLGRIAPRCYEDGSFAVRARRAGSPDAHPFSSTDIERRGGDTVWTAVEDRGVSPTVDLEDPDVTFHVECRPETAFVFLERRDGPGGLPVGTQAPFVVLVSGGIDSPVAAWLAMKRGSPIYPVYIDLGDYGGVDHRMRARETVSRLDSYAPEDLSLRVVPGGAGIDRIVSETESCRMPVLRRFMFRIAERIAETESAVGIVTGESAGQKSSQTATNLRASSAVTSLPIHRPLLSMDKTEITELARDIGTFDESTIDAGCYRLAPDGPATRPTLAAVERAEPSDIDPLVAEAVADSEVRSDLSRPPDAPEGTPTAE